MTYPNYFMCLRVHSPAICLSVVVSQFANYGCFEKHGFARRRPWKLLERWCEIDHCSVVYKLELPVGTMKPPWNFQLASPKRAESRATGVQFGREVYALDWWAPSLLAC